MNDKIIKLVNVSKIFGKAENAVIAVDSVSLEITKGDFIVISGPSGSGKSTLMNLMAGLMEPTDGELFVAGKNLMESSDGELSKLRKETIGFIFQSYNLIPSLTAIENVLA